jgi:DnaJ-domain-containing protein 1
LPFLTDPSLCRCLPQLRLHGAAACEESTLADGALLAEVMEAREAAAEARGDAAALAALAADAAAAVAACEAQLRAAFAAGDLRAAAAATTRLSYLTKLADELADSRHDAAAQADAARRA